MLKHNISHQSYHLISCYFLSYHTVSYHIISLHHLISANIKPLLVADSIITYQIISVGHDCGPMKQSGSTVGDKELDSDLWFDGSTNFDPGERKDVI